MALGLRTPRRGEAGALTSGDYPTEGDPSPEAWDALTRSDPLDAAFFQRPVAEVARCLLGARLESWVDGVRCGGVIVETEAYGGSDDPASHAATRSGVTDRNRAMFGPAGRAYVYRSYGIHWCLNVVTGPDGCGEAVLLRGLAPIVGVDEMAARRGGRRPLTAGPGRLAQALGVDARLYGHPLDRRPLLVRPGWRVPDDRVVTTGRVGISTAADRLLRFYVARARGVSKPSAQPSNAESA